MVSDEGQTICVVVLQLRFAANEGLEGRRGVVGIDIECIDAPAPVAVSTPSTHATPGGTRSTQRSGYQQCMDARTHKPPRE